VKVAATAQDSSLDAMVDEEFGRCRHFLVVDTDTMGFEDVSDHRGETGGCAGSAFVQLAVERGVGAIIIGRCGPGALAALQAANLDVFAGAGRTVREAVSRLKAGGLETVGRPSCEHPHSGGCCHGD